MKPLRLEPIYISSVWAGTRLQEIRDLKQSGIGIAREVCAYRDSENKIAEGEWKGKSIRELINERHTELMGKDESSQLIRAAYIDAKENLSIQVHPAEAYARRQDDFEKSESWYVLEAADGAYVVAGTVTEDKEKVRRAAAEGNLEDCIRKVPVKAGDFILIPAGMLHACGKDMLVIEIGSFGGITYRVYDYGRPRSLDLEKAFDVLDLQLMPVKTEHPFPKQPVCQRSIGVEHPLFHVDVIDINEEMTFSSEGRYSILICVQGRGVVQYEEEEYSLAYTQTLLMPASVQHYKVKGNLRVLQAYRPIKEE